MFQIRPSECWPANRRNGDLFKAINDVDEVIRTNQFISHLDKASPQDAAFFKGLLGNAKSGTIVVLRKCDGLQNKTNMSQYGQKLAKHVARIFREFINSDERSLHVNEIKLERIDPLRWDDSQSGIIPP